MKFERLPQPELKKLEKEFVQFLASNTITADDWVKIKSESTEKADELIDMFSDIVYQKVLEKVEYLEFRIPNDIKTFRCQKDKIVLMGMAINGIENIDLRKHEDVKKLGELTDLSDKVRVYSADKNYKPNREQEMFRMMKAGAQKTNGTMFLLIEQLYKKMS